MSTFTSSSSLGYPNIGANREWKKALEAYWSGRLDQNGLLEQTAAIRLGNLTRQQQKGLSLLPVGDFTLYDRMLDTSVMFGLVPSRFGSISSSGDIPLDTYFAMARGNKNAVACAMTKWFNTNYHYIVPELEEDAQPRLTKNLPLEAYREAKIKLGISGKPVIIGLYTFLKLSKGYEEAALDQWVQKLLPLYKQLLSELQAEGAEWVQIDEPALVTNTTPEDWDRVHAIYSSLHEAAPQLKLLLQTYFEAPDDYDRLVSLPVQGIGLDFVHDQGRNLNSIRQSGFPEHKTLFAGVIDGRGIWRADLSAKLELLEQLTLAVPLQQLVVQPSSSLLHVPVTTAAEQSLNPSLLAALSFADEKLEEVAALAKGIAHGRSAIEPELVASLQAQQALQALPERYNSSVRETVQQLTSIPQERKNPFAIRHQDQLAKWQLPFLPTTTIGSFPQTPDVRKARAQWRKGELTSEQYDQYIEEQIRTWIDIQERIGLDVLVHGEFERTDMVEFFGEKLAGFAFTSNGWVQSYGSRCVKPPVIYGDVRYVNPMTVKETVFAQSLTNKPVKGMLTGPVTILNWSFVRDDLPRSEVAFQIGLALRQEVAALEAAGIEMIQVDEPALREGLPLRTENWQAYLDSAVLAFRLSTTDVRDTTQIHTHMCYSEFSDIIESISALDADVISIETSRSHGELIHSFEEYTYDKGIGLGVYDIHSPRIPSAVDMASMIERALRALDPQLFWVNPDCGLKTRGYDETAAALENMVEAARLVRVRRSDSVTL